MVVHNGTILLCGGVNNDKECLKLDHGTWRNHSAMNEIRHTHSAIATPKATFLFGGSYSITTYEYLPNDSNTWILGKSEIPGGFWSGCAIASKSNQEIWLIGGIDTMRRILSFNFNQHTFQILPSQLNVDRVGHRCAFIPNTKKVLICGGFYKDSTEIFDTENGTVTIASPMNSKRGDHGIGIVTVNGDDRIAVFGGFDGTRQLDSVELYNNKTEKWEHANIKLDEPNRKFGFLSLRLSDVISHL